MSSIAVEGAKFDLMTAADSKFARATLAQSSAKMDIRNQM
jgi:hypothetical protein